MSDLKNERKYSKQEREYIEILRTYFHSVNNLEPYCFHGCGIKPKDKDITKKLEASDDGSEKK